MDADSNGTGPESPGRHLHVQNSKNGVKVENTKFFFFQKFFFLNCVKLNGEYNGTGPESRRRQLRAQNLKKPIERVEKLEVIFFQIFFLLSMQNLMLISKIQVPNEKVDILVEKNGKNDV